MFYNFIGFYTLLRREIKRFMKVYMQTILSPLITNMLFLGVFGAALKNRTIGIEGVDYLHFLIPGLCALGAISNAFQNPSSSLIIQRYQNVIQDINSYPISILEKVGAYIIAGAIRGALIGVLTYIASIPFLGASIEHPLVFLLMLILVSAIFSALGLLAGLGFKDFDQIGFVSNFIITPLIYFGGVFFELSKLPAFLSKLAYINPMVPLIDVVRFGYLGSAQTSLWFSILYVFIFLSLVVVISYIFFKKGVGLTD